MHAKLRFKFANLVAVEMSKRIQQKFWALS